MKKNFLFLSIFLLLFLSLEAVEKISLEQAVEDGLKISGSYKNRFLSEKEAELRVEQSLKDRLFSLDLKANYLYKSDTMTIEFPGVDIPGVISVPGQSYKAGLYHNYDLSVSLSQPLFNGGVLSRREEMEKVREAVEANKTELERDSLVDIIKSSFYDYQILMSQKKAVLSLRKTLKLHSQKLSDLYTEGLVKKTDLLETKSRLEEADMNINDLNRAIDKVSIDFHSLCGHYPEGIEPVHKEAEQSEEQALDYFENHHPVLKTMEDQKKVLELQKKIVSGKYLPSINGFAELHYGKPGIDYFAKEWSLYFQGGVVLNMPVFDWNKGAREKDVIDVSIRKLENQKDDFVRDIIKSLQQLYSVKRSLNKKKANIENMIAYSKEDAALKKALYEEKQIPNVDYLAALQSEIKYESMKRELSLQIEKINVKINTLISRTKEYGS